MSPAPYWKARCVAAEAKLAAASAALDALVAPDPEKSLALRICDEFADFQMVIDHCSKIYAHVTNGRISKPNTLPSVVLSVAEELEEERTTEAIREALDGIEVDDEDEEPDMGTEL
jgi:hypothetical protein